MARIIRIVDSGISSFLIIADVLLGCVVRATATGEYRDGFHY
jgi:hypothetical protein